MVQEYGTYNHIRPPPTSLVINDNLDYDILYLRPYTDTRWDLCSIELHAAVQLLGCKHPYNVPLLR